MRYLKYYQHEDRRYGALRSQCVEYEVRHVWRRLCKHFGLLRVPRLEFVQAGPFSWASRTRVIFVVEQLTWLVVAHELAHCIVGQDGRRGHTKCHALAVEAIVGFIEKKRWNRGAVRREMVRRRARKN